jgi:hypothetical protein
MNRFLDRWCTLSRAQNAEGMERMITFSYFKFWWALAHDTHHTSNAMSFTARNVIERILIKEGWLRAAPESPSERAMRRAEKALTTHPTCHRPRKD